MTDSWNKFWQFGLTLGVLCLAALNVQAQAQTTEAKPMADKKPMTKSAEMADAAATSQEYYELRIYKINDFDKQKKVEAYLSEALLPALNRMKVDRVGVFTNKGDVNDHSVFMLIPFKDINTFVTMNATLAADAKYQTDAKSYFDQPLKDPLYTRIESRFMKAFESMPVIEMPAESAEKKPRMFELRLYQSHTEDHARRKVQMFNKGETQLMRDSKMAPVFFGETLIGQDAPNLVYMLSASDDEAHKAHWKTFIGSDGWAGMKDLPEYKDTVSKIEKWFLSPTDYSQL